MSCPPVLSDYYTSVRVLYNDCNLPRPVWAVDPEYIATAAITFVVQTVTYALRVAARIMKLGTWGWDDHACAFAYVGIPQPCKLKCRTVLTRDETGPLRQPADHLRSQ